MKRWQPLAAWLDGPGRGAYIFLAACTVLATIMILLGWWIA